MEVASFDETAMREAVRKYILDEFLPGENPAELTDAAPLITGGILDSIGTVKLVSFLEEEFEVQFEAGEVTVDYLDTIDRIVEIVREKRDSRQ
ncbi:MAG: acyl carrier protein [Gemmatimonadota bacterium]